VVVEGKSGKLEGNGGVSNAEGLSGFYKPQLHPSHFPRPWEVGGPNGGRGVSVFNNYRQLIRRPFCIINGFLFSNRAKGGCTVTGRTFSCNHLTVRQEVSSHHPFMR